MASETPPGSTRPTLYACPACHLHLLTWDAPTDSVEVYHKIGLWADFWTGQVRIICQYCLGATDVLPDRLVRLLCERYATPRPAFADRRDATAG